MPKKIITVSEEETNNNDNNLEKAETFQVDRRFTGRNQQLNLKVTSQFIRDIKEIAYREDIKMVEVMERILDFYKKNQKKN